MDEPAQPGWIVLPRYEAGAATTLEPLPRARALVSLVENAFNFAVHGRAGFETLADWVTRSAAYRVTYGDLADATARLSAMADEAAPG